MTFIKQKQRQRVMSQWNLPHDNLSIILDYPSISHINLSLRLIETNNLLPDPSSLSLVCLEKPQHFQPTYDQLQEQSDQDSMGMALFEMGDDVEAGSKKKKNGCTCKKTNCIKMYCECFSVGKMCTPECVCFGCYNHSDHQTILQQAKQQIKNRGIASNRHNHRGCNCKKSNCQKKYCECFNAGVKCTGSCGCSECCNKLEHQVEEDQR